MANSLSANFPEFWSRRIQKQDTKKAVYKSIANFEETGQLKIGDKVHRPYESKLVAKTVGASGAYTRQDITSTDESLTVDQKKETSFYIEDADEIQTKYPAAKRFADRAAVALINLIDGDVLGEYDQADSTIANYEMGGGGSASDGIGLTVTTSNILKMFSLANRKLTHLENELSDRWAVISPEVYDILTQYLAGKDTSLGDSTGLNGHVGKFMGFDIRVSTATGWSGRLEVGTIPANGETIIINGVTITFVSALSGGTSEIHICSNAAKTVDSLVAFLNAPATAVDEDTDTGIAAAGTTKGATGYTDAELLRNVVATDGTTYITLKVEGEGYVEVSETLGAAADIWTTTKQIQHCLFGQGKPTDIVIQKYPNLGIFHRDGYIGKDFVTWTFYGMKTFDEGDRQLVDIQVRSDAF